MARGIGLIFYLIAAIIQLFYWIADRIQDGARDLEEGERAVREYEAECEAKRSEAVFEVKDLSDDAMFEVKNAGIDFEDAVFEVNDGDHEDFMFEMKNAVTALIDSMENNAAGAASCRPLLADAMPLIDEEIFDISEPAPAADKITAGQTQTIPPKILLDELDAIEKEFSRNHIGFSEAKKSIADAIKERHGEIIESLHQPLKNPREWVLCEIRDTSGHLLRTGNYHILKGVLGMAGNDLLAIFDKSHDLDSSINPALASERKAAIRHEIRHIG